MDNICIGILASAWKGVWAVDRENRFIFFNKGMEDISGLMSDYLMGKDLMLFLPDQTIIDEVHFRELFHKAREELTPVNYSLLPIINSKGELMEQSGQLLPLLDEDGSYTGMVGTVEYFSTKKIGASAGGDGSSERKLDVIYRNSPVIAFLWKPLPGWPVVFVSENISRFGYHAEEFTSGKMLYSDMVYPEDLSGLTSEISDFEKLENLYFTREYRIVTRYGEVKWVTERSMLARDERGGPSYYQGIIIDITHLKEMEYALKESEEKYRLIFENSPLGIFNFGKDGTVTHCNDKIADILGIPKEQILGFNMNTSLRDEKMKAAFKEVLLLRQGHFEGEYRSRENGKAAFIKVDYSPNISGDGTLLGGVGIVEDIRERKQAEEKLREYADELSKMNKELQSVDRMKSELLSNVSHELRTPLTSIKGYSDLLMEGTLGEMNYQQLKAVNTVIRNTERLRRLVDSLLYVSMAEVENIKYDFSKIDVLEVIDNAVTDMTIPVTEKKIDVLLHVQEDVPQIEADAKKIADMLTNVLDNAVKFTPSMGKISISARKEGEMVHISVEDTGIGIPSELVPHLFQKFYQIDPSIRRKYGGTGLGLFISRNIVEAHKGKIWIESEDSQGTTVHILLPVQQGGA
ncbi:PAS domain S-box [Methanomethylovorans hollandica DSM 15978]|uniref:histidine kinase n=1 Tax=Methanomethylovorans hollandica (strain DSM 15978 / NBRC 107637 / DMS1) TaxID=867904 RepID=L0KUX3_METHD|nr:PAS domain-containing sensor histidine kinase [Methanomethylovorans hollandica]AGB49247.1 PAS domain S-box [Methanomethylovorans hollandica DSM 15978]